jgi:riboflavin kinase/FMN adenylyltransferase
MGSEHDFSAEPVELKCQNNEAPISSTAIRQHISVGDVVAAKEMLTRPHELTGIVVHGDHEGRTLGFPTANTEISPLMSIPSDAVYSGRVRLADGRIFKSAISIGVRPMFHEDNIRVIEAHLLDFDEEIYGQEITIEFESKIREQLVLENVDQLVKQITLDVDQVRTTIAL